MIFKASVILIPDRFVLKGFSEPDKSTICNLDNVFESSPIFWDSIWIINKQWDLVEASFFGVSATTLLSSPNINKAIPSWKLSISCIDKFVNINCLLWFSLILTLGKLSNSNLLWVPPAPVSDNKSYPSLLYISK